MSWIEKLYRTYENCTDQIGDPNDEVPLLPICHTTQKAHITVVIDGDGNFCRAYVVPKVDSRTIIPATEESAGRTSGATPHPLCDKLQYVAADYVIFGGDKEVDPKFSDSDFDKDHSLKGLVDALLKDDVVATTAKIKNASDLNLILASMVYCRMDKAQESERLSLLERSYKQSQSEADLMRLNRCVLENNYPEKCPPYKTCHEQYVELLEKWVASSENNVKLTAFLKYIKKGRVIKDLVDNQILHIDALNRLINKWSDDAEVPAIFKPLSGGFDSKGKNKPWQADAFVRWSVDIPGDLQPDVWLDKSLWNTWQNYYGNLTAARGLCYVTGIESALAEQHPAKIRNDGDKAKLISSNDQSGFTYRGRFNTADEAAGVGFEVTQKAHKALSWLIARQGFVEYVKDGKNVKPSLATIAWAVSGAEVPDVQKDTYSFLFGGEQEMTSQQSGYTAQEIGLALTKKIAGYSAKLGSTDDVVVMGIDSATPGRLAISYYRELTGSELLSRVKEWHEGCSWHQIFSRDKLFVGAPAPRDIAEAAYGTWGEGKLRIDEKLRRATVERLLPCIIDGAPVPRDLVESCVRRTSNRQSYKWAWDKRYGHVSWEWEKALGIACALYRYQHKERSYSMALDRDRKTRDYLYGRLLALAERLEGRALYVGGEKRETNAGKLMQRFAERPYSTWLTIETSLAPYKVRLRAKRPYFLWVLEQELDEVFNSFIKPDEYTSDQRLTGEFLLGYHCQRSAPPLKKEDQEKIDAEDVEDPS